jgi:hypothetical protein
MSVVYVCVLSYVEMHVPLSELDDERERESVCVCECV